MTMVMRIVGLACGMPTVFDGQYLVDYEVDTPSIDSRGRQMDIHLVTTPDIQKAKRFKSLLELRDEWARVSKLNPQRSDGKPNRPLTAFTIEPVIVSEE